MPAPRASLSKDSRGGFYERTTSSGLIVGYAAAPEHTFPSAVNALAGALANMRL